MLFECILINSASGARVNFEAEELEDQANQAFQLGVPVDPQRFRSSKRPLASASSASPPAAQDAQGSHASRVYSGSILAKLCDRLLASAIKSKSEVENLRQALAWLSIVVGDGTVPVIQTGSACSGTEIYELFTEALLDASHHRFESGEVKVEAFFACDNDPTRRDSIQHQFPSLDLMIPECKCFKAMKRQADVFTSVLNAFTNASARVPRVRVFCNGFSCKSVPNRYRNRKQNKGCIKEGSESTGETFWFLNTFEVSARSCPSWKTYRIRRRSRH